VRASETDTARKGVGAREEKKREETHKRYIGAIKGDRQGHRGSEERDTGSVEGRRKKWRSSGRDTNSLGARRSERTTGSSGGERETDSDPTEKA